MQTPQERIGARLRIARGGRQPIELAVALGVNLSTIYRWEAGKAMPPVDRQADVADAYGQPWSELFDPIEAVA